MLFAVALAHHLHQLPTPLLWLKPDGQILISGRPAHAKFTEGASALHTQNGYAFTFNGQRGGILFPDAPDLAETGSMTVSGWIYLRSYVNDGPGAQVLFRGDDRSGLDPYNLAILSDGTITWGLTDDRAQGMSVRAEIPLFHWTHVVASYDAQDGKLTLWENGVESSTAHWSHRPFRTLDNAYTPGVGVGNVQNDHGPHNQPLNGILFNLRLDRGVGVPDDFGYDPHFWDGNGTASTTRRIGY